MRTRVREIRKQKGYTLEALAKRIRPKPTTPQTIGRLETETRKMTLDWLEKLADALECSPTYLIDAGQNDNITFVGTLAQNGRIAPATGETVRISAPGQLSIALKLATKIGELDVGDTLICVQSTEPNFQDCLGKDCYVVTIDGVQTYGRLIQGSSTGRYTVIPAGDSTNVLYDIIPASVARRSMMIRHF